MKRNDDALRSALLLGVLGVAAVWAVRSGLLDAVLERLMGVHGGSRELRVGVTMDLASHSLTMEREPSPAMEGVPLM